jgi:hypothetical protein
VKVRGTIMKTDLMECGLSWQWETGGSDEGRQAKIGGHHTTGLC